MQLQNAYFSSLSSSCGEHKGSIWNYCAVKSQISPTTSEAQKSYLSAKGTISHDPTNIREHKGSIYSFLHIFENNDTLFIFFAIFHNTAAQICCLCTRRYIIRLEILLIYFDISMFKVQKVVKLSKSFFSKSHFSEIEPLCSIPSK